MVSERSTHAHNKTTKLLMSTKKEKRRRRRRRRRTREREREREKTKKKRKTNDLLLVRRDICCVFGV